MTDLQDLLLLPVLALLLQRIPELRQLCGNRGISTSQGGAPLLEIVEEGVQPGSGSLRRDGFRAHGQDAERGCHGGVHGLSSSGIVRQLRRIGERWERLLVNVNEARAQLESDGGGKILGRLRRAGRPQTRRDATRVI